MSSLLCSRCSEEVRPVVAIDIDGTLGDYHAHFIRFANEWLGGDLVPLLAASLPENGYDCNEPFSEYCGRMFGIDLATYRQIKLAYRQGGMKRSMPIFPRALEAVHRAFFAGAEVWVTTTRPYLSLDNIVPDTVEWCRRHGIEYDGMLFDEDKYAQLAERVNPERVVAVLDDLPEMVTAANDHFTGVGILVARGYNVTSPVWPRFHIGRAGTVAAERAKEWIHARA